MKPVRTFAVGLTFLCLPFITVAQNADPLIGSEKAIAAKASSNINFSTGVMNYSIPLFGTAQDGYQIPVSLGYNASGIKVEEKSGVYGLGWALNFGGGVISRSVRGSYADENVQFGILKNPIPVADQFSQEYTTFLKNVNLGVLDGESDVFTLQVNGNSVHFLLQPSGNSFVVKPLERTNLKITCKLNSFRIYGVIVGWTVVDEQGIQYQFDIDAVNVANIYNSVYSNGGRTAYVCNWYLTSVTCVNKDKITFEYIPEDLLDVQDGDGVWYTRYGTPILANDYGAIGAALGGLSSTLAQQQHVQNTTADGQFMLTGNSFHNTSLSYNDIYGNAMNADLGRSYYSTMSGNDAAVSSGYSLLNYNPALNLAVGSVVHPSGLIQAVQDEWKTSGQNNLYAKKLIKKIQLRNTVIEFDYAMALSPGNVTNYKTAIISSITYRSIAGDLIKKVVFVINEAGFLKSVKTLSSLNTLEKNYSFNYFDEGTALSRFSQDYWGYYNGKPNQSLLPLDPNYYIPVGNVRVPVFSPQTPPNYTYFDNTEYPPGDRLPDAQFSKARSLKSVSDHLGGTTNFEYEGNEIFILMADKNVQVGGIRIKSVKTEDATGQVRKLNYKYAFPLLNDASKIRSTGEFFEWATRGFSELHANDEHIHSHMDYNGIHCLPVGSNDVLYHYVEEQAEDNSATGYKFFAVNALNSAPHNDLLDGKLMAQISYDASGKIVSVRKYQYATNFGIEHSRSDEVGFMNYSAVPYLINEGTSAELVRQHKKVKIFYDRDDILRFSSAAMDILGWNGNSLGIPSVGKMIYDNYYPRSSQSTAGLPYELTAGIFVRPTSSTVYTFSDYAPSVIPGSAPAVPTDEKAYLFEKLLASSAERAQQIVRYFYESAVTQQPTRIESTDSKGRIRITKHKYVCDYASDAAPFIAQLKAAGRNFDLVETQQWISTNGGSTFKLMNGAITRFEEKQSDNRTFVLPVEKLNYLPNEPADLTSYGQSATATGPYSSVFWENHALYKQEQTYNWQLNALFAKLQGTTDRTGHLGDLNCYDNLTGNLLIKAVGVNPGAIAGVDMAPFQSHSKYAVKGWFKSEIPVINPTVYTFSDRPFSNGLVGPFFDYVTYATGALERLNEWWQRGQQGDIPSELGNHRLFAEMIPLFYSIKSRVPLEAFVEQMHFFRKAMATIEMDPEFMNLVFTYLDVADFLELLQSTETISNMCSPDFSIYEREIINIPQHMSQLSSTPLNIEKARLASNKLDVYVVRPENQAAGNVQYKVKYRNGTISAFYTIIPAVINERIVKATLDLTTISNPADAVEIQFASNWSCYAVPQGVSFEAYTYLPDNQQMLSFNQTGRYTEKVYDEYGDVVQVTDNKHIATANTISFSGKGDAVTSEIIPVKVINEPHLMHTGPVVKRITLYQGAPFMETKIVESTFRVIPGSEYTFNIRKGIYRIEVELENVFTTVTVNGVQYAGAMTVNLNTANELLIHVSAQP